MIERERRRRLVGRKESNFLGIVLRLRRTPAATDVNHRDRLSARIPIRSRIDSEQRPQLHIERSLFERLAYCRLLDGLAEINEASRDGPSIRDILAFDQRYTVSDFGDYVGGNWRSHWTRHAAILTRLAKARQHRELV